MTIKHIYIVGFMGSGKSTIGPILASELDRSFHDLDTMIEKNQQSTITQIFESEGEAFFRKLESRFLLKTQQLTPCVISLGGGTFIDDSNRNFILKNGVSIWLKASIDLIKTRCQGTNHRPLAQDPIILESLLHSREKHYQLADIHINIQSKSPKQISQEIITKLDKSL